MNDLESDFLKRANDGTPDYGDAVGRRYRKLQYRLSIFAEPPRAGSGIRLGIYQAQGAYGDGATEKNVKRMEEAVQHARKFGVHLLSFPELFVPGYTLDPESARSVSEYKDGPSITRAREIAQANNMGLIVPFAEKSEGPGERYSYFDSIAVIDEQGRLLDSYRKTHLYAQQERDNWDAGESTTRCTESMLSPSEYSTTTNVSFRSLSESFR